MLSAGWASFLLKNSQIPISRPDPSFYNGQPVHDLEDPLQILIEQVGTLQDQASFRGLTTVFIASTKPLIW